MMLRTPGLTASLFLVAAAGAVGCATDQPTLGETRAASTVATFGNTSGGCSTSVVLGLSTQIAQEAACLDPDSFVSFENDPGMDITSSAVLPYLVAGARADLDKVAAQESLQINSALRTIAQQYLLYNWYLEGRCGITAAAHVGNSNHEGGRAVDLANYSSRLSIMANHGWAHDVPGDVVHFDHTSSPDDRGQDVLAFQKLWNLNNPSDPIGEDGDYGPQTEKRLKASPATGFAKGATCATSQSAKAVTVSVDGPDHIDSGATAHYAFTVQNASQTDWSDTTSIAVRSDQPSQLYDAGSWASATTIGTVPGTVAAGDMVTIEFDVQAPTVTADLPIAEPLVLMDGGAVVGTINFGVTVTAHDDDGASSDDSEPDPAPPVTGGCNTGGGSAGWLAMLAPLALVIRRRRRA
nr:hypothetical protein [Kofleriaceae bacterium]